MNGLIVSALPLEWEAPIVLASCWYGFLFLVFFPLYWLVLGNLWKAIGRALALFVPFWAAAILYWHHALKGLFQ